MGQVKRVYVEKKQDYAIKAKELLEEVRQYLGLDVENIRVLIRYDVENVSEESYQKALGTVFSELLWMKFMRKRFLWKKGKRLSA